MKRIMDRRLFLLTPLVLALLLTGWGQVWAQRSRTKLFVVQKGSKYGYINSSGRLAIPYNFDFALPYRNGYALIKRRGKYGYLSSRGNFAIRPKFESARSFSDGLAAVRVKGRWGYINKRGRPVILPRYRAAGDFSQRVAPVYNGRRWGYINAKNKAVIGFKFIAAKAFSSGRAPVRSARTRKWGFINKKGRYVIKPRFTSAEPFSDGLSLVRVGRKYGFINSRGKAVIRARYAVSSSPAVAPLFRNGHVAVYPSGAALKKKLVSYITTGGAYIWRDGKGQLGLDTPPAGGTRTKGGKIRVKDKTQRFAYRLDRAWPPPKVPRERFKVKTGSDVVLPPGWNPKRKYPAWIVLPYTGGTTPALLKNYLGWRKDLTLQQKFALYLKYLYPNPKEREKKKFIIFLPAGRGSTRDHSARGFKRAMARYEARAKAYVGKYHKTLNLDLSKVVIGGHSLGGDLSWALPMRNPNLFGGAVVMGSRASYRDVRNLRILRRRRFRYFLSMGAYDKRVRQAGQASARAMLRRSGVQYSFFSIPRAKHSVILPETPLMAALNYVMFSGKAIRTAPPPPPPPEEPVARPDPSGHTSPNGRVAASGPRGGTGGPSRPISGADRVSTGVNPAALRAVTGKMRGGGYNGGKIRLKDKRERFAYQLDRTWPPPRVPRERFKVKIGGDVVLPPGWNPQRKYPVWIVLPYTGGTTPAMLKNYLGWRKDLNLHQKFALYLTYLYPDAKERERKKFIIFLPSGRGSTRDHSARGFARAMARYEARAKAYIKKYKDTLSLDTSRVVVGGHSLGGDLSWALPFRNPRLFGGAIVMGSRASYRNEKKLRILKRKNFRYFFSMGANDRRVRQAGQARARALLRNTGLPYYFFSIPRARHSVILPETPLMAALDFVMFRDGASASGKRPDSRAPAGRDGRTPPRRQAPLPPAQPVPAWPEPLIEENLN